MATQLQIRRGTSTQVAAFTGAEGEIVVNTTNDSVHVNDGSTAGGFELARADFNNISASATLTIGTLNTTNLDLTNLEVTNIKAKDGTAAGSIADSTGVVTLISSSLTTADITTLKIGGTTVTATAAELNYVDGVTSAIQTQIDAKAPIANPTFTGSFTSPGIDDNADAIAITIDSSENVGIGTISPEVTAHVSNAVAAGSDNLALRIQNPTNAADARVGIGFHVNAVTGSGWDGAYIQSANTGSDSGDLRFGSVTNNTLTEAMRIDGGTGNVGLGLTPHNWAVGRALELGFEGNALWGNAADEVIVVQNGYYDGAWKYATTRKATHYSQYDGTHRWFYAPSGTADSAITWATAMTITNTGYVGITQSSSSSISNPLHITKEIGGYQAVFDNDNGSGQGLKVRIKANDSGNFNILDLVSASTGSDVSVMTVRDDGNVLVSTTDSGQTSGVGLKLKGSSATAPSFDAVFNTASAVASNFHHYNTNATYNGYRFYIQNNGGVANFSANNVNLSDERVKTNIENSGDYLAKICAIPVRLFNYNDEPEGTERNLGVIAQEVEAQAPELVSNQGFGETPEDGVPLKSVYTTDMTYALMKCIQEQQTLIESLTTRIAALEQ